MSIFPFLIHYKGNLTLLSLLKLLILPSNNKIVVENNIFFGFLSKGLLFLISVLGLFFLGLKFYNIMFFPPNYDYFQRIQFLSIFLVLKLLILFLIRPQDFTSFLDLSSSQLKLLRRRARKRFRTIKFPITRAGRNIAKQDSGAP